jgi:hypothetical protein
MFYEAQQKGQRKKWLEFSYNLYIRENVIFGWKWTLLSALNLSLDQFRLLLSITYIFNVRGCRGRDRMIVGFTATSPLLFALRGASRIFALTWWRYELYSASDNCNHSKCMLKKHRNMACRNKTKINNISYFHHTCWVYITENWITIKLTFAWLI